MKKFSNYSIGFFLICISITGIFYLLFSNSLSAKLKIFGPNLGKGGVVYNYTTKNLKISSDSYIATIPAGKNSLESGIRDVDAIIIRENKVLKFCNYAVIEVRDSEDGELKFKTKNLSWICKLVNKYNVYSSVKEAFGQI